jgi:predicted small lipoprotein YifL
MVKGVNMKFLALALILALSLTACGRRGAPTPPGPASAVIYPHEYPAE